MNNNDIREKYLKYGFKALSEPERIRLILSYSENSADADRIADQITEYFGCIRTVSDADPVLLKKVYGLSESSTVLLGLLPAVSRLCAINGCRDIRLNTTENARKYFTAFFSGCRNELVAVATVNKNFKITSSAIISYGDVTEVSLPCRNAAIFAYERGADFAFIAHCHPNGSCEPSQNDISATMKLMAALDLVDIPLADHIITAGENAVSMREFVNSGRSDRRIPDISGYSVVTTDG